MSSPLKGARFPGFSRRSGAEQGGKAGGRPLPRVTRELEKKELEVSDLEKLHPFAAERAAERELERMRQENEALKARAAAVEAQEREQERKERPLRSGVAALFGGFSKRFGSPRKERSERAAAELTPAEASKPKWASGTLKGKTKAAERDHTDAERAAKAAAARPRYDPEKW